VTSVHENETHVISDVLNVISQRVVLHVMNIELILHTDHVSPRFESSKCIEWILTDVIHYDLHVKLPQASTISSVPNHSICFLDALSSSCKACAESRAGAAGENLLHLWGDVLRVDVM